MSRQGLRGQPETKLAAEEREVIVTYNDAEKVWRVYSDSATMRGTLLRLARQTGAEIHNVGDHGLEFACPAEALRLAAKRRARPSGASLTNLRRGLKRPDPVGLSRSKRAVLETAQDGDQELRDKTVAKPRGRPFPPGNRESSTACGGLPP